jgi:hypothetical protein
VAISDMDLYVQSTAPYKRFCDLSITVVRLQTPALTHNSLGALMVAVLIAT